MPTDRRTELECQVLKLVDSRTIGTKEGLLKLDRKAAAREGWPKDVREAFQKRVDRFWSEADAATAYENPDNIREARVGNPEEEAAFKKAEESGCCGSFEVEWELETVPPVKVRYGFNYGH